MSWIISLFKGSIVQIVNKALKKVREEALEEIQEQTNWTEEERKVARDAVDVVIVRVINELEERL